MHNICPSTPQLSVQRKIHSMPFGIPVSDNTYIGLIIIVTLTLENVSNTYVCPKFRKGPKINSTIWDQPLKSLPMNDL